MIDPETNQGLGEKILAKGRIFELVQFESDGRTFELARRAPGVRLIIPNNDDGTVLLTREFRRELNDWDYRLPGGKVFDTLEEFEAFRSADSDIIEAAKAKAKEEGIQETGIEINDLSLFKKSVLGATVEWDLYVFEATDWQRHSAGQQLEHGEVIEADTWMPRERIEQLILEGKMQEERIALILLQWLRKK